MAELEKGTVTPETIATWQQTGGKGGGRIAGGRSLPKRYVEWHNARFTPPLTEADVERTEAWQAAYPPHGKRTARKAAAPRPRRAPERESFQVSDHEREMLSAFRLLPPERQEEIANEIEAESREAAKSREIEQALEALARLDPDLADIARKHAAKRTKNKGGQA